VSILSASGSITPPQAAAYTQALLDLLGNKNPLHILRDTPDALRTAIERVPPVQLSHPEAPGKWSTRQVIQHLADSELVAAFRLRLVLAQDRPALTPYDQDLWAHRLRYQEVDIQDAMDQFSVLRRTNLRYWNSITSAELARVGLHAERGEESLEHMRRLYAGHDLAHLHQLARIRIVLTGH
jgi:hypothetical protein